jgi:hypothetical protein
LREIRRVSVAAFARDKTFDDAAPRESARVFHDDAISHTPAIPTSLLAKVRAIA